MKLRSYQQVIEKSIIEVKQYLLINSQGYYQEEIADLMNSCLDVYQLRKKINKRADLQLWLFSKIKMNLDQCLSYDEMENHLIMMNLLLDSYYRPMLEYKYNLFYYILQRTSLSLETYCLLRHLIKFKPSILEDFIKSITVYDQFLEYEYHHFASEVLLLEKQYKKAYQHLPYIDLDLSLKRFEKALYNYSPYRYKKLLSNNYRTSILAYY